MEFVLQNWYLFVALAVVLAMLYYDTVARGGQSVSPMQATRMMNHDGAAVVDVSEPSEFASGHIAGAMNVPLKELDKPPKKLGKYKSKPVIVCCRSGNRAPKAAAALRKQGFETTYQLTGGLAAWQKDKLPVQK